MPFDTPQWVRDAVFYQIFPDRFASSERVVKPGPLEPWDATPTYHGFKGGDLLGIAERLDHLERLGISAIYLTPIFSSASNHRYHTFDYLQVDPLLGGDAALRELLDAAHVRGIRVVLDGVFNHASRGFWPFHHVLEAGGRSPYVDWFYLDPDVLADRRGLHAYPDRSVMEGIEAEGGGRKGGAVTERTLGYRAWWDLPALPKLKVENPHVREYLLGVAEHWIRFGVDGWRLDVPGEIADDSFWREFRTRVRAIRPDAYIVGEVWEEDPRFLRGDMFDAHMNYPFAIATLAFVAQRHLDRGVLAEHGHYERMYRPMDGPAFAARLEHLTRNFDPAVVAVQLNLIGSHDIPRFLSFVSGDTASFRLATLVQMTFVGAPCVYYGDEVGLAGRHDPLNRGAFPWDEHRWDQDLLAFTRGAIAYRHAHPALRHGTHETLGADGGRVAFLRATADEAIVIALNAGEEAGSLTVDLSRFAGRRLVADRWAGWAPPRQAAGPTADPLDAAPVTLRIPARDALVLRVE